MAVLTALTTAIVTSTITAAAVAEAAVVVGATLSVVGAATGNKELGYAGMALGAAGGLAGLAGAAGVFDPSTVLYAGSQGGVQEAAGQAIVDSALNAGAQGGFVGQAPAGLAEAATSGQAGWFPASSGVTESAAAPSLASQAAAEPTGMMGAKGETTLTGSPGQDTLTQATQSTSPEAVMEGDTIPGSPGAPEAPAPTPTPVSPSAPGPSPAMPADPTSTATAQTPLKSSFTGTGQYVDPAGLGQEVAGQQKVAEMLAAVPKGGIKAWFDSLSPAMQASVAMTAGQAIAGGASGLFQGMAAEDKLDLERVIAARNQAQVAYRNQNNAYAPTVTFTGMGAKR